MKIQYISNTRLQTMNTCPKKYFYVYELEMPSPMPKQEYFTYGIFIHKIAETYVLNKGKVSIGKIYQDVMSGEILEEQLDYPVNFSQEYKKRIPNHLKNIEKISKQLGFEGHVEHPFFMDLEPPNEVRVKGFLDRLIIKNNNYFVIDYKTTKKSKFRKDSSNIHEDLQLRIYARVVQKEFNVPSDKIFCALYYLDEGELLGVKFSQNTLDNTEKELINSFKKIKNMAPEQAHATPGKHCYNCDYKSICPYSITNSLNLNVVNGKLK